MEKHLDLEDILMIEDDASILDFYCKDTGIPVWALIRTIFIRMVMADYLYPSGKPYKGNADKISHRSIITLSKSVAHNALHMANKLCRYDVCIITTGASTYLLNGKYFNRLSDYFARVRPSQSLVIESQHEWKWPFPRHFDRILLQAPYQTKSYFYGKMFCNDEKAKEAEQLIGIVKQRAKKYLKWEVGAEREKMLVKKLTEKMVSLPYTYHSYEKLFNRISPKLLMVEGACYGALAAVVASAKNMGIITAEHQHGAIMPGHDGYNFSQAIQRSSEYKKIIPDYFLSYGKWWDQQINAPLIKVPLGNPHRSAQLANRKKSKKDKRDILILGDGFDTSGYLNLAVKLAKRVERKFRVVFRPHPTERQKVASLTDNQIDGIIVDQNADIYESFESARYVVSELSTGLFEAVGIVDNIIVWNTPKAKLAHLNLPFTRFNDIDELCDLMIRGKWTNNISEELWESDWKSNYKEFLSGIGVAND